MNETAKQIIDKSAGFGGDVFLASIIVVSFILLASVYVWRIAIPNAEAFRASYKLLTEAVAAIGRVTGETHEKTDGLCKQSVDMGTRIKRLMDAQRAETIAVMKVAKATGVDIQAELGQMRGSLGMEERPGE